MGKEKRKRKENLGLNFLSLNKMRSSVFKFKVIRLKFMVFKVSII